MVNKINGVKYCGFSGFLNEKFGLSEAIWP